MEDKFARDYLSILKFQTWERGPYHFFNNRETLALATSLAEEVVGSITWIEERTWRANSPWHAAAWLINLAAGTGEGKPVAPAPSNDAEGPPLTFTGALLFRGQRNSSWPVTPSFLRLPESEAQLELQAIVRFVQAMTIISESTELPALDAEAHIAVAQHYELRTYLLDMTIDPRIATFFACDKAENGDEAVVYWLPFRDAVELGARMVIPPPWAERVNRQKGMFLDFSRLVVTDIKNLCHRVVFPVNLSYLDEFADERTLYPDHRWFKEACLWARKSTLPIAGSFRPASLRAAKSLCRAIGKPSFAVDSIIPARLDGYLTLLQNFLDWLILKIKPDQNFEVDCLPIRVLARDNRGYLRDSLSAVRLIRKSDLITNNANASILVQYMDAIDACLEAYGESLVTPLDTVDLDVTIVEWFEVDENDLRQKVLASAKNTQPHKLRIRIIASRFEDLCTAIRSQVDRAVDWSIANEQNNQILFARNMFEALELNSLKVLMGIGITYGFERAVTPLRAFIELGLLKVVYDLASFQNDDERAICHGFRNWLAGSAILPVLMQRIYRRKKLLEIFVSPVPFPEPELPCAKVYLPPEALESDAVGKLLPGIWQGTEHFSHTLWSDYVVPQLMFSHWSGGPDYTPWTPDKACYCTEGNLWIGGDSRLTASGTTDL